MSTVATAMPSFTSGTIASISEVYDTNLVDIVWKSSEKVYTYRISDVDAWQNDLLNTIEEDESVGSYVNFAKRTTLIQEV